MPMQLPFVRCWGNNRAALAGLVIISAYELIFAGFKDGGGFAGLGLHLSHEFSLLANLFLLLAAIVAASNAGGAPFADDQSCAWTI
jgi:hypothetical protein